MRTSELKFANEQLAEEIREKEEYARELQETNEMYKLLTENMFDVIWKARITPDGSWQFIYRSPSVQNLLGYTVDVENLFREADNNMYREKTLNKKSSRYKIDETLRK